ncbi:MAG: alpha/beta fold hydrolase [Candidatus Limnocylindria bacterium]
MSLFADILYGWTQDGFIVVATDYEGLGTPGLHPYFVGESEGRAVLDAARAARGFICPDKDDTVALAGHSQGGHAALFAAELAPTYAEDLPVVGTVAVAPAGDLACQRLAGSPPEGCPG